MFNVILFSDTPEFATKTRGYGCHRLASHIRERGYSCLVIDFCSAINFEQYKQIVEKAVGTDTLLVGFSTTWLPYKLPGESPQVVDPGRSYQDEGEKILDHRYKESLTSAFTFNRTSHWFEFIKAINPKTKISLGGTKVDMYLDQPYIDYVIVGYGETMMIDLLDSLSKKTGRIFNKIIDHDQKARNNVWDFKNSKTIYTEYDFIKPNETLSLEVSRGCKFKCSFCSYPLIGEKNITDYIKHEQVLREELLDNYNRWGTTQYYIMDDTFNDSYEKLQMLKRVLDTLPFKINFWCYLRLDLLAIHTEQIQILLDMGLSQCYFGIESFHPKASKAIGKGMSAEKRKATLELCRSIWKDKVHIQAGFIVGLPYEPVSSIKATGEYLKDANCPIDEAWVFPLSIAAEHESTKYMYKSDMDKNYKDYGYFFQDPERFWQWSKLDDTDIPDLETADRVASENDPSEYRKLYRGDFYRSSLNHPVLGNREKTLAMTDEEYDQLLASIDRWDLYMKTVEQDYIKPLIKKLQSKK